MTKTLIIAEQRGGKIKKPTFELVSAAKKAGHEVHVAIVGHDLGDEPDALGGYGAGTVYVLEDAALKFYNAESSTKALLPLIEKLSPRFVLLSHTPTGRDLAPHLAVKLNGALATDCTAVEFSGDEVTAKRPVFAGKAIATVEFVGDGPRILTVRPNALGAGEESGGEAEVLDEPVDVAGLQSQTTNLEQGASERPDVTEASIVVSGGRSLKSSDNFKILEDLADTMGAAVGASRAAVDAGYRPHRDQVGQTGKVVSPNLYLAFGISGAIQHLAGMRTSKHIVAVNTDADAPIFQLADLGIVGDLFEVVPAMTEQVKQVRES
jgi:electron transfer flavoprotein alpha subunit